MGRLVKCIKQHLWRMVKILHWKKSLKNKSRIITWWLRSVMKYKSLKDFSIQTLSNFINILMTKVISFWFCNLQKVGNFIVNLWDLEDLIKKRLKEWLNKYYQQLSTCIKIKSFTEILNLKTFFWIRKGMSNLQVVFI